jgi:hypothetical protein
VAGMSKQVYCQPHGTENWGHKAKVHKDYHLEAEQEVLENRQMKACQHTVHRSTILEKRKDLYELVRTSQKRIKTETVNEELKIKIRI